MRLKQINYMPLYLSILDIDKYVDKFDVALSTIACAYKINRTYDDIILEFSKEIIEEKGYVRD